MATKLAPTLAEELDTLAADGRIIASTTGRDFVVITMAISYDRGDRSLGYDIATDERMIGVFVVLRWHGYEFETSTPDRDGVELWTFKPDTTSA